MLKPFKIPIILFIIGISQEIQAKEPVKHLNLELTDLKPINTNDYVKLMRDSISKAQKYIEDFHKVSGERTITNTFYVHNEIIRHLQTTLNLGKAMEKLHPDKSFIKKISQLKKEALKLNEEIFMDKKILKELLRVPTQNLDEDMLNWLNETLEIYRTQSIDKSQKDREYFKSISSKIRSLADQYISNLNQDVRYILVKKEDLNGLPNNFVENHHPDKNGNIKITTERHDFYPFMKYASNQKLRKELWIKYNNLGYPKNQKLLFKILKLRKQLAEYYGYNSYAEFQMKTNNMMANNVVTVKTFLDKLGKLSANLANKELEKIIEYRNKFINPKDPFESWDYDFWCNRYKENKFGSRNMSKEIREYFSVLNVKEGLLKLTSDIFDINYRKIENAPNWHSSVETYDIYDNKSKKRIARIHLDLYSRKNKFKSSVKINLRTGIIDKQLCELVLSCDFPNPSLSNAPLLEIQQVITFFHEFGHLLHESFIKTKWTIFSSCGSVQRDFVEGPSQMLESWVVYPEVLKSFARHYKTNLPIPDKYVDYLQKQSSFGLGYSTLTTCAKARLSLAYYSNRRFRFESDLYKIDKEIKIRFHPTRYLKGIHEYARFVHIVMPNYSSTYYQYLWSRAIAEDIFSEFRKKGVLNPKVAQKYRISVLEPGGSKKANVLIKNFLGRAYSFESYFQKFIDE